MNTYEVTVPQRRISGGVSLSAVALVLLSSAVLLISIVLLLNFISGIVENQSELEKSTQAVLTEESAMAGLETDFRNNSISNISELPVYSIGDFQTSFNVVSSSTIPPEELIWWSHGSNVLSCVPAGSSIFVLSESDDGLRIDLLTGKNFETSREVHFIPEWNSEPYSVASTISDGEPYLFLVSGFQGSTSIAVISGTGSRTYYRDIPYISETSLITAGSYNSSPALLISEGSNLARMFIPGSLSLLSVSSVPGTTPVFYGQDRLFGEIGNYYPENEKYRIIDLTCDDFDANGTEDLVFTGTRSMCFVSEDSGILQIDTVPDGRPVAWGVTSDEGLLSTRWLIGPLRERWRVLTHDGFVYSSGPEFFPFQWQGRLSFHQNSMIGSIDDSLVIIDGNSGQYSPVCENRSGVLCQLDGEELDLVYSDDDTVRILLNPLAGNGLIMTLEAQTAFEGSVLRENLWNVHIYGGIGNRRIHFERAG